MSSSTKHGHFTSRLVMRLLVWELDRCRKHVTVKPGCNKLFQFAYTALTDALVIITSI